jgi:mRNA interferase MazF
MIQRGDIRWFRFAVPDKRRPVLILGRPDVLSQLPVIPLSTQLRGLRWEVALGPDDGLPAACGSEVEESDGVAAGVGREVRVPMVILDRAVTEQLLHRLPRLRWSCRSYSLQTTVTLLPTCSTWAMRCSSGPWAGT